MKLDQIEQYIAARDQVGSGPRAREIRETAGFTQAEIADLIGVSQGAMSRLEAGTRQPRRDTLLRWADAIREMEKRIKRAKRIAA